jgi:hypothetical protein
MRPREEVEKKIKMRAPPQTCGARHPGKRVEWTKPPIGPNLSSISGLRVAINGPWSGPEDHRKILSANERQ